VGVAVAAGGCGEVVTVGGFTVEIDVALGFGVSVVGVAEAAGGCREVVTVGGFTVEIDVALGFGLSVSAYIAWGQAKVSDVAGTAVGLLAARVTATTDSFTSVILQESHCLLCLMASTDEKTRSAAALSSDGVASMR